MNSSLLLLLLLLRAAPRPVNARSVPRPRLKAISSTLFCCPQSTAASATLRFNFLSLSLCLTLRDCGVLGAGGAGLEWGILSPFSSRLLLRAAALIKAARLSFLSCSRRRLPSSPPASPSSAACFGAFYNNYSLGFVNISCRRRRRFRTWLRFVRPPLLPACSSLRLRPSIFYDSIIRCAFAGASKSPSIPASS